LEISLTAMATDCIVRGLFVLGGERLADHLNADDTLDIRDATLESLEDGHVVALASLEVPITDLCVVVADGPRGAVARRIRDRADLVEIRVGPYTVVGDLRSPPGSGPFEVNRRRGAFIAMTEATVVNPAEAAAAVEWPVTLLVNWSQIGQVLRAGTTVDALQPLPSDYDPASGHAREILP